MPKGRTDDPGNWLKFDQILPHIFPSRAVTSGDEETRQLLIDMVRYLWKRNDFDRALSLGTQLADLWETELGPDHWQHLFLQSQLANVLRIRGGYEEARALDQIVLERQRSNPGIGHGAPAHLDHRGAVPRPSRPGSLRRGAHHGYRGDPRTAE